jgi:CheY-like chemotaxis protein
MAQLILVEPDRVLAGTYKDMLEAVGHQVIPVSSAQAAIIAADYATPDAIILELQLIEHSGIEFLYEFRSYPEWFDIPVIVHTQVPPHEFNDNQQLLRQQLNVQTYLYKPQTTLHQLRRAVSEAIAVPAP